MLPLVRIEPLINLCPTFSFLIWYVLMCLCAYRRCVYAPLGLMYDQVEINIASDFVIEIYNLDLMVYEEHAIVTDAKIVL